MSTNGEKMRLRLVLTADFRKNEATLLAECQKQIRDLELRRGDCILLLSTHHTILKFVWGAYELDKAFTDGGIERDRGMRIVASKTYRIVDGGKFNPYMLKNYAEDLGIDLAFLRRFEEHFKDEQYLATEGYRQAA